MIGDTLRTDIKGAKNAGIKAILCTETGVTANEVKKRLSQRLEILKKDKSELAVKAKKIEEMKKFILIDIQREEDCAADYLIEGVSRDYNK
jgi:predicted HAD superfamily phosphohydrolase YqeG